MLENAKRALYEIARDRARLPIPWSCSPNVGFTSDEPRMLGNDDYKTYNAAAQEKSACLTSRSWKSMPKLRRGHKESFMYGKVELLDEANKSTFAVTKTHSGKTAVMVSNFAKEKQASPLPGKVL